jgi:hypothetical protein
LSLLFFQCSFVLHDTPWNSMKQMTPNQAMIQERLSSMVFLDTCMHEKRFQWKEPQSNAHFHTRIHYSFHAYRYESVRCSFRFCFSKSIKGLKCMFTLSWFVLFEFFDVCDGDELVPFIIIVVIFFLFASLVSLLCKHSLLLFLQETKTNKRNEREVRDPFDSIASQRKQNEETKTTVYSSNSISFLFSSVLLVHHLMTSLSWETNKDHESQEDVSHKNWWPASNQHLLQQFFTKVRSLLDDVRENLSKDWSWEMMLLSNRLKRRSVKET